MTPVLFWSGGKDSWLALHYWLKAGNTKPVLFTTFDEETGIIPHQNIPIKLIQDQALKLECIHFAAPLSYPSSNLEYLNAVHSQLQNIPFETNLLLFGDLHLTDIRKWREDEFGKLGYSCKFPIWGKDVDELLSELFAANPEITVTASDPSLAEWIKPGDTYNSDLIRNLPPEIDPLGENGEFHTFII